MLRKPITKKILYVILVILLVALASLPMMAHAQGIPLVNVSGGKGGQQDEQVDRHLHIARTPAACFLKVDRHDGHAAEAGAVTNQNQNARACQQPRHDCGKEGVEVLKPNPLWQQLHISREQADGHKRLEREEVAKPAPTEHIKRQVDDKQHRTQRVAQQLVRQKRHAGGAAREQPSFAK